MRTRGHSQPKIPTLCPSRARARARQSAARGRNGIGASPVAYGRDRSASSVLKRHLRLRCCDNLFLVGRGIVTFRAPPTPANARPLRWSAPCGQTAPTHESNWGAGSSLCDEPGLARCNVSAQRRDGRNPRRRDRDVKWLRRADIFQTARPLPIAAVDLPILSPFGRGPPTACDHPA